MILNYLRENYKECEPIFIRDIEQNLNNNSLQKHMESLVRQGVICKFKYDPDVYYIPGWSALLNRETFLSVYDYMVAKYIKRQGECFGYSSGSDFINDLQLSTQVPFVQEITSNFVLEPCIEMTIGKFRYILKQPVTTVTKDNVETLMLLDALMMVPTFAEEKPDRCGIILSEFAERCHITKERIDKVIGFYPEKIYQIIYDTEIHFAH